MIRYITHRPPLSKGRSAQRSCDRKSTAAPRKQSPSLIIAVREALRRHGLAPTRFGRNAIGDPRLIEDIGRGRELRRNTELRVRAYIASLDREAAR